MSERAVVYCRVSSSEQQENYSLPTQQERCRAHAEVKGWTVVAVESEQHSGADLHGREGLQRALTLIENGGADILLAFATDRLSREQLHIGVILDRVLRAGASLQFVTEDFENSPTGKFLLSARTFAAELELAKIGERTQRGRRARVAAGKPIAGPRPAYGYTWNADKSRYLINPETAPVVRLIFDWALDGVTLRGIVGRLHERGIASPTGQDRWTPTVLRHLLLRHVYTGDAMAYAKRADRKPDGGYTRRTGTPDELISVPNVAEPIVTREEMAAVAARLTTNKAHAARNNRDPHAALLRAGFAVCGHCGWHLGVSNPASSASPNESARYHCDQRARHTHGCPVPTIAASLVDGPVWARVSEVLRDPEIIAREVAKHRSGGGLDRDLAAIEKQFASVADRQSRTARAIAAVDDDDAAAPLIVELKALAARKNALDAEREAIQRRLADERADAEMVTSLSAWCARVNANIDRLTYAEKRMALDALGAKVRVFRLGTVNSEGTPNPRWTLTLNPVSTGQPIVYPQTGSGSSAGSRRRGSR